MSDRRIVITDQDHARLQQLIDQHRGSEEQIQALQQELEQARIVPPDQIPPDTITMNSTVLVRVEGTRSSTTWTVVYPDQADIYEGRISVLEPLGTALLGYQAGDVFDWVVPAGPRRYRIVSVVYQPEAAGDLA